MVLHSLGFKRNNKKNTKGSNQTQSKAQQHLHEQTSAKTQPVRATGIMRSKNEGSDRVGDQVEFPPYYYTGEEAMEEHVTERVRHNVFIKFKSEPLKKSLIKDNSRIQGEAFHWGLFVKNIDNSPSSSFVITNLSISKNEVDYNSTTDARVFVKELNPNEEVFLEIDTMCVQYDGTLWVNLQIEPSDSNHEFMTHQQSEGQVKITPYYHHPSFINHWAEPIIIKSKSVSLQEKTNLYILILTVITTWQGLFGIKETVKNVFFVLSRLMVKVSEAFNSISSYL